MKSVSIALYAAAALIAAAPLVMADVVTDAASCTAAVEDAQGALASAQIGAKARSEAEAIIAKAVQSCADKNFKDAEKLLADVRGIAAGE